MSFDPFGQHPEAQPPGGPIQPGQPGGPPPGQPPPGWYDQPPVYPQPPSITAKDRVQLPAMFLIAIGAMNLLWALLLFVAGFVYANIPADQVEEMLAKDPNQAGQLAQLKKMGWSVQDIMRIYTYGGIGGGSVVLLASLLTILGGARMLVLRNYGLAVFSSVLAAVPCISPMSCPCLFIGLLIGCWSLVVLLNEEVRAGFR